MKEPTKVLTESDIAAWADQSMAVAALNFIPTSEAATAVKGTIDENEARCSPAHFPSQTLIFQHLCRVAEVELEKDQFYPLKESRESNTFSDHKQVPLKPETAPNRTSRSLRSKPSTVPYPKPSPVSDAGQDSSRGFTCRECGKRTLNRQGVYTHAMKMHGFSAELIKTWFD
ncbi:hypothetical protein HDV03_002468 [Kappamyces sp. JEL0829]|nr:hypothetical protein HDV03_002468 [Kappamyces sp. JEL0829]